jgi:hypothetical protein
MVQFIVLLSKSHPVPCMCSNWILVPRVSLGRVQTSDAAWRCGQMCVLRGCCLSPSTWERWGGAHVASQHTIVNRTNSMLVGLLGVVKKLLVSESRTSLVSLMIRSWDLHLLIQEVLFIYCRIPWFGSGWSECKPIQFSCPRMDGSSG